MWVLTICTPVGLRRDRTDHSGVPGHPLRGKCCKGIVLCLTAEQGKIGILQGFLKGIGTGAAGQVVLHVKKDGSDGKLILDRVRGKFGGKGAPPVPKRLGVKTAVAFGEDGGKGEAFRFILLIQIQNLTIAPFSPGAANAKMAGTEVGTVLNRAEILNGLFAGLEGKMNGAARAGTGPAIPESAVS